LHAGRPDTPAAPANATPLARRVAAAFLALIAVGAAVVRRTGPWLWWLAAGALVPLAVLGLLFPEAGEFPFWFSAWWPLALFCALALVAIRGLDSERDIRTVTVLYLALATVAWIAPNPLGGNLTRLGSLFGGPVLLAILLAHGPTRLRTPVALGALVVGLCWQVITPLPDTFQSLGDPATKRSYYAPAVSWLRAHGAERDRIEIPYTFNHWETAYVSPDLSIARGWLRQLDLERNSLFYEGTLTHERYRRWLADNGIRWVAASDARLDYSAQEENDLVRSAPPYLKLRATLDHWRIYEVVPRPPAVTAVGDGQARLRSIAPESFTLDVTRPGHFVVRVRHNPYWDASGAGACVGKAGKWTLVRAPAAGRVVVRARFDTAAAWRAIRGATQDC
jgi:hypothetical protein